MREIKFRAWHKTLGLMIYKITVDPDGWHTSMGEMFGYGHEFAMQFTGLKDKNGKEIYEGDIVRWDTVCDKSDPAHGGYFEYATVEWCEQEVGWRLYASFMYKQSEDVPQITDWTELEVIGNIYENRDLLELGPPHDSLV